MEWVQATSTQWLLCDATTVLAEIYVLGDGTALSYRAGGPVFGGEEMEFGALRAGQRVVERLVRQAQLGTSSGEGGVRIATAGDGLVVPATVVDPFAALDETPALVPIDETPGQPLPHL
jgi:hypothetical protein